MRHTVYTAFYRKRLNELEKKVYDALLAGLESWEKKIKVMVENPAELDYTKVKKAIALDNPQLYYVEPWGKTRIDKDSITMTPTYMYTWEEFKKVDREVRREVRHLEEFMSDKSDYEKVQAIHDRLVRRITYGKIVGKEHEAHSIVGALKDYKCVCDGFSKLFKYVMDDLGVRCLVVSGESFDPQGINRGTHAWNIVRVNHKNYQMDVTWDHVLEDKFVARAYFLISDEEFRYDHMPNNDFILPKCPECYDKMRIVDNMDELIKAMVMDYQKRKMFSTYRLKNGYEQSRGVYTVLKMNNNDANIKEMNNHIRRIWFGNKRHILHVMWGDKV